MLQSSGRGWTGSPQPPGSRVRASPSGGPLEAVSPPPHPVDVCSGFTRTSGELSPALCFLRAEVFTALKSYKMPGFVMFTVLTLVHHFWCYGLMNSSNRL